MRFSIDYFNDGDITEDVILHEMAHVLGFGTVSAGEKGKAETGAAITLLNTGAYVCYGVIYLGREVASVRITAGHLTHDMRK